METTGIVDTGLPCNLYTPCVYRLVPIRDQRAIAARRQPIWRVHFGSAMPVGGGALFNSNIRHLWMEDCLIIIHLPIPDAHGGKLYHLTTI